MNRFESPIDLYHLVKHAWSQDTVSTPFDLTNPCRNQCAVTALAAKHYFGGDIVKTATKGGTHFYNLIDGRYWDLASDQFDEPIPYENVPSSSEEAHEHATDSQFASILANVEARRLQEA
jgi:hypothetical protein